MIKRKPIARSMRMEIMESCQYKCQYCGKQGIKIDWDKFIPRVPYTNKKGIWVYEVYSGVYAGREWRHDMLENPLDEETWLIPFQIDHILPVCQGGENNLTNLLLVCRTCNSRKATRDRTGKRRVRDGKLEAGYPEL